MKRHSHLIIYSVIFLLLFSSATTTSFGQAKFEIIGTANVKYNGASVNLLVKHSNRNICEIPCLLKLITIRVAGVQCITLFAKFDLRYFH